MTLADYSIVYRAKDMLSDGLKGIVAKSEAAAAQAGQAADRLGGKVKAFGAKNMEVFSGIAESVPGLSGALGALANPYVAAGAAVVALGTASYQAAADWEKGLAKVNVTAQMSKAELAKYSDEVLRIASNSYGKLQDAPEALNKLISAGLNKDTALASLKDTLNAAKAGFTDAGTAAGALTAVMNASGIQDSKVVYDKLFATLNKGNAEFGDIAQYLPKIVPSALQVGFSLDEVSGAFATMTAKGQTAEATTTMLQNAFKALGDPARIADFNKMGIAIFDQAGKMRPLTTIVNDLNTKMAGLTDQQRIDKLASLGLDMEASQSFAVMAQNAGDLAKNIDFVTNSSKGIGELGKAVENSATSGDSWQLVMNKVQGALVSLGGYITPVIGALGNGVLWVIDGLGWLAEKFKPVFAAIQGVLDVFMPVISTIGSILGVFWNTFWNATQAVLGGFMAGVGVIFGTLGKVLSWFGNNIVQPLFGMISMPFDWISEKLDWLQKKFQSWLDTLPEWMGGGKSPEASAADALKKAEEIQKKTAPAAAPLAQVPTPTAPPLMGNKPKTPIFNSSTSSSGGAAPSGGGENKRVNNITITIQKLIGVENLHVGQFADSREAIERGIREYMTKAVRDSELAIAE